MASAKELTGGLGDVNPQQLTIDFTQTGVDDTTTVTIPIPRPRFIPSKGKSVVLEVLRVYASLGTAIVINASGDETEINAFVSTSANFGLGEPDVFANFNWTSNFLGTTTQGYIQTDDNRSYDLTDGAGHGFLVATDELNFTLLSVASSRTNRIVFRVLYRYKAVNIEEFLGIVQSQI